ncbi:MAG: endonuclease III domain-containing protein [Candidatus Latescibacterota bacterium]
MSHNIDEIISILRANAPQWGPPIVTKMAEEVRDPYRILIATLISLRTRDEVTGIAANRLFEIADTPEAMVSLPAVEIEKAIYPATFHQNKAFTIKDVSKVLLEKYGGRVPDTLEELLSLNGVGRKTANLVLIDAFGKEGICVDTHVHRITNRWGYVSTRTPDETEFALREKLPKQYWMEINKLLVPFGQHVCKPVSPHCSHCPLFHHCMRVGVTTHR